MKKIISLMIGIMFATSSNIFSQNYHSLFGDSSTSWNIIPFGACDAICSQTFFVTGDTTIGTNDYKAISGVGGFLREDTVQGKAWYYDTTVNAEYLIMDLSLQLGDTFYVFDYSNNTHSFIVDSVFYSGGKKHVRMNLWTIMCALTEQFTFIEGSGTSAGFSYQKSLFNMDLASYMLCHYKEGIKITGNALLMDSCDYCSVDILELGLNKVEVRLYPNPVRNELTVNVQSYAASNLNFALYNMIGETVVSYEVQSGISVIDLSSIQNGIYVVVIRDKVSGNYQRIVKQ